MLPSPVIHTQRIIRLNLSTKLLDELLHPVNSTLRASGLGNEHLALLVDDKDAALGALGDLLEADGTDERRLGVAQQRVGELLLVLESRVGLGRVGAETVDGQAAGCEGLIRVAEEADLLCACDGGLVNCVNKVRYVGRVNLHPGVEALG